MVSFLAVAIVGGAGGEKWRSSSWLSRRWTSFCAVTWSFVYYSNLGVVDAEFM